MSKTQVSGYYIGSAIANVLNNVFEQLIGRFKVEPTHLAPNASQILASNGLKTKDFLQDKLGQETWQAGLPSLGSKLSY